MLTSSTSQLTARARCSKPLATASATALLCHRHQQERNFRFGRIWTSTLNPGSHPSEFYRDICRRQRKLRYKHVGALGRRSSWEDHPDAKSAKKEIKRMIHDFYHGEMRPERRRCTRDASRKTPDNPTGVRPGQNIEDVERGPMEYLLFGNKPSDNWFSSFRDIRDLFGKQHLSSVTGEKCSKANNATGPGARDKPVISEVEVEYVIDPITNRKVPKAANDAMYSIPDVEVDSPTSTTAPYTSQFAPFTPPSTTETQSPIFYDGPPPAAELEKYAKVKTDSESWNSAHYEHVAPSVVQPLLESEEYEKSLPSSNHEKIAWHPNDGLASAHGSIPIELQDSDSTQSRVLNAGSFENLAEFGSKASCANTLDGNLKPVITASGKNLEMDKHGSAVLKHAQDEPHTKQYSALNCYTREPNVVEPAELNKYKPFKYNEPDGKAPLATEENQEYDPAEVQQYQAFRYNEPDGNPPSEQGDIAYDPLEVQKYQAFRYNEPDGQPAPDNSDTSQVIEEEAKYQPFKYNEPDGRPAPDNSDASQVTEEEAKYQPFKYNEPDGRLSSDLAADDFHNADLSRYQVTYLEPDPKLASGANDNGEVNPSELRRYESFGYDEQNGGEAEYVDSTARAFNEFDREQRAGRRIPYIEPTEEERAEDLDLLRASDIRSAFEELPSKLKGEMVAEKANNRDVLAASMSDLAIARDAEDQEAAASVQGSKQRSSEEAKQLTGNYVRDFPEEFARSWTSTVTPEPPAGLAHASSSPLVSALDRQSRQSPHAAPRRHGRQIVEASSASLPGGPRIDSCSKERQGLQTSYQKEVGGKTQPVISTQYGDLSAMKVANSAAANSKTLEPAEPTMYKVLAYDPNAQAINVADTTSIVASADTPLNPAEVLLRLSNPAKFFPYFGSLEAQGYEIASGSGDILVFRKVRDATTTTAEPRRAAATPSINPIDMTGSSLRTFPAPAISRFASPTGFVNYELPSEPQPTDHRFVSKMDVRREEPIFSGEKKQPEGGPGAKSIPKRMAVGAAWLAGVSYALGVVGEYFRTGGADGMGPRGL